MPPRGLGTVTPFQGESVFVGARARRLAAAGGGLAAMSCLTVMTMVLPFDQTHRSTSATFAPTVALPASAAPQPAPPTSDDVASDSDPQETPTGPWSLVGLGDSVLTHCRCPGVLADYAQAVAEQTGRQVHVDNAAAPGSTSSQLLHSLHTSESMRSKLADADAVVIFIGANDFAGVFDSLAAGASSDTLIPVARQLHDNLTESVNLIRETVAASVPVLVCGYWNDFKDGQVAQDEYSEARRRAAALATEATDEALAQAAVDTGARYVSTSDAFSGYDDRTDLLAADGDHLSAQGAALIAAALVEAARPAPPTYV